MSNYIYKNVYNTPENSFICEKQQLETQEASNTCYKIEQDSEPEIAVPRNMVESNINTVMEDDTFLGFSFFKFNFDKAYKLIGQKMNNKAITEKSKIDVFYAPSDIIKQPISIKIKHINLRYDRNIENSEYIFEISCEKSWYVKKSLSEIERISKKNYRCLNNPYLLRNHEIQTTFQIGSKEVSNSEMQYFIVTDVVKEYNLKSEYIFIKEKDWCVTRIKILGRVLALYKKDKLRYVFKLQDCDVFPVTESKNGLYCFVLYADNKNNVLACMTEDERNEWVRYLRKIIYNI